MVDEGAIACGYCGRVRSGRDPNEALAWVCERERGAQRWLCPACAREQVRNIEGKLPTEYW